MAVPWLALVLDKTAVSILGSLNVGSFGSLSVGKL